MAKNVMKIPAWVNPQTAVPIDARVKRKVAGYARVSTDHNEQLTSYEAQLDYYTTLIKGHDDWEFAGMYSDEGVTGTSTKKREGFQSMVSDALAGKIDLIITKSVSRFARNTVDSLSTIRHLKEHGTEVYFEKENIWTFDSKGELLITIMSSLAQEESRSISENVTWGHRKRMADGKVSVAYSNFLGYDKGENGTLVVNREQAKVVKLIYGEFIAGLSCHAIAEKLTRMGIKTPRGKDVWSQTTVRAILTNEKYKGDALLQKTYTPDFLTKKQVTNHGEVPQYYVTSNHEAIIEPEIFDRVQDMMKQRGYRGGYSGITIFSSKIVCGECGGWYGSKVWHSNDKYRKVIYRCNGKYKGGQKCGTPHLTEDEIKALFLKALNELVGIKDEVLANLTVLRGMVSDTAALTEERERANQEAAAIEEELRTLIAENARVAQDQDEYDRKYCETYGRYEQRLGRMEEIDAEISEKDALAERIRNFIDRLMELDGEQTIFDEMLWGGIMEHMTVYEKGKATFTFVGGIEVTVG